MSQAYGLPQKGAATNRAPCMFYHHHKFEGHFPGVHLAKMLSEQAQIQTQDLELNKTLKSSGCGSRQQWEICSAGSSPESAQTWATDRSTRVCRAPEGCRDFYAGTGAEAGEIDGPATPAY